MKDLIAACGYLLTKKEAYRPEFREGYACAINEVLALPEVKNIGLDCCIDGIQEIYVAEVNTDLTEGRGWNVPIAYSSSLACITRIGKGKNVQGCNATIRKITKYKINGKWVAEIYEVTPTKEDEAKDRADDIQFAKDKLIIRALDKAKELGMTDEEIELIYGKR